MPKVVREINTSIIKRIYVGILQVRIAANKNTNSSSFQMYVSLSFQMYSLPLFILTALVFKMYLWITVQIYTRCVFLFLPIHRYRLLFFLDLFIYFWPWGVFTAAHRLSLVAASGDDSSLRCTVSLQWPPLPSMGSRAQASVIAACDLHSCGTWA